MNRIYILKTAGDEWRIANLDATAAAAAANIAGARTHFSGSQVYTSEAQAHGVAHSLSHTAGIAHRTARIELPEAF
jgi:hypothetical protein